MSQIYSFPTTISQKNEIAGQLKKGDIIFTKYTYNFQFFTAIDAVIVLLQRIAQAIFGKQDRIGCERMVHAAIVVDVNKETGEVLISEAMPTRGLNDLRVVNLFKHKDLALTQGKPYEYHVFRAKDDHDLSHIMESAAKIAINLGTKASYLRSDSEEVEGNKEKKHKFSFVRAFNGVFNRYWNRKELTFNHTKRMFKMLADEHLHQKNLLKKATGGAKSKKFFCSYFVGHVLQQAELGSRADLQTLRGVKEGLDAIEQMDDTVDRNQYIRRWANQIAGEHFESIKELKLTTSFDPKSLAPQDLMRYLAKRTDQIAILIP